jgi:drug/metabolite transporter (DMT)-like permease
MYLPTNTPSEKRSKMKPETAANNRTNNAADPPKLFCQPACLSNESYSLLILVCSSVLYSIMAAFVKLAVATGIPSTELVFLRAIFQGFFVVLAMLWFRDDASNEHHQGQRLIWNPFGPPHVRNVVLARGVVGGVGFLLYYYTMSTLPLGDATTLLSLNPVITVLAASFFLGEKIRTTHIVAAVASMIGCLLIAKPSFLFDGTSSKATDEDRHSSAGYITALMGACCGAAVYILIRRAGKGGVHTLQLLFSWVTFGLFFSLVVGVVIPVLSGQGHTFVSPSSSAAWGYIFGVCIFGSLGHFLMNYAARHAPAGLASVMRSSGIMWSYTLELVVFQQVPQGLTLGGATLILLSLAMIAVEKHQESTESRRQDQYAALAKESSSFLEQDHEVEAVVQMEPSNKFKKTSLYGSVNV